MRSLKLYLLSAAIVLGCSPTQAPDTVSAPIVSKTCDVGIYGSDISDDFLVITQRDDNVRYSFSDGRTDEFGENSLVQCVEGNVQIDTGETWARKPINVTDTRFDADNATLAGQLLEPLDAGPETPLVIIAHGSEELGWIGAVPDLYQLVGRDVSVFVYDKRGTGLSTGQYSQNFPELADDLVAASEEAKRMAEGRFGRFGLFGLSQGGWIAPLAAQRSGADFVGIGYGLVVDILEEDAAQVELELTEKGMSDEIIAIGKQITDVTARLAVSNYQDGLDELAALQAQYGEEPWFQDIRGGFSGVLLGMSTDQLRDEGIPMFDRLNIDWSLVPMDVLRQVDVPQLWVLAEDDREAPVEKSLERLNALKAEGKDITIFMFPDTDHGMWEFRQAADGSRDYTRVTDGFYELMADWAKGGLEPPYGNSAQP